MSDPKQLNPAESTRDLLRVGPVRNLLGSSVFISSGVMLQATVLGKQIYDITGRELDIGLLGLAEFLPAALLVLVTGSVADRFNRKIVGGIAVAFELLCSIALAFYALSKPNNRHVLSDMDNSCNHWPGNRRLLVCSRSERGLFCVGNSDRYRCHLFALH